MSDGSKSNMIAESKIKFNALSILVEPTAPANTLLFVTASVNDSPLQFLNLLSEQNPVTPPRPEGRSFLLQH